MIKSIIFDFGDVFIDLDKAGAMQNALELFNIQALPEALIKTNMSYEKGELSSSAFIDSYHREFAHCSRQDIIKAWNFILKDFPKYRVDFIKRLNESGSYQLILLSNTNELHIQFIKEHFSFYEEFKSCFQQFYLSHEIQMRKPDRSIFEFVLSENNLDAEECLFIDDTKENTDVAATMGIKTWTIDENSQDVVDLFEIKKPLF